MPVSDHPLLVRSSQSLHHSSIQGYAVLPCLFAVRGHAWLHCTDDAASCRDTWRAKGPERPRKPQFHLVRAMCAAGPWVANSAGAQAPVGVRGRRGVAPLPAVLPWLAVAEQPCKQNNLPYKHVSVATCGLQRQPATGSVGLSCQRHAPS